MSFSQVMSILRSRWRIIFAVLVSVFALALVYALFAPKHYLAYSSVVIDTNSDPLAGAGGYADNVQTSYVSTQTEVIASERVAQRVVRALKLDQLPENQKAWREATNGQGDITVWLAKGLLADHLSVGIAGESKVTQGNVINIAMNWRNPEMAATLANAFAQAAIETNIELKIEPAKQYAKWFDQHSRALRGEVEARQKRLSDFENATGIIVTDEKLDVENARLAELSTQLVTIQGLRQDSQSRQRQAGGGNESLPEVLQSPVIARLKADLSDAEARQSDIAGRLGKNHPDFQAAATEVASLHERIAQESEKIAGSLGSAAQINVRRESDVRQALEQQKKRILDLKHQRDEAVVLESDVTTAQRDLDAVTQRYAQSSLESQAQQTSMVLLTTATPPFQPVSPKLVPCLLVGLFLGTIMGMATALLLELRDPRVRGESDVIQLSGVPLLAKLGSARSKNEDRRPAINLSPARSATGI